MELKWQIGQWNYEGIGIEDHGCLTIKGFFNYEGGGGQGLGYIIDDIFIYGFLKVFGVENLEETNKKIVWVLHDDSSIHAIKTFTFDGKRSFNIKKWGNYLEKIRTDTIRDISKILSTMEV